MISNLSKPSESSGNNSLHPHSLATFYHWSCSPDSHCGTEGKLGMSQSYSHEEYWTTQSYYFNFIEINNYILCSTSTESFTSKQKHEEISLYVWCTVFITQNVCVCVCSYSNWLTHMVYALLIALVTPCLLLEDLNGVLILHIQLQKKSKQHFLTWLFRCPVGVHAAKWIDISPMTIPRPVNSD